MKKGRYRCGGEIDRNSLNKQVLWNLRYPRRNN